MIQKMLPENIGSWMKENPDRIGIHLLRFMFAFLWLSEGLSKIRVRDSDKYADHNGFLGDLNYMKETNPNPLVVSVLEDILIPYVSLFLVIVVFSELFIGLSLGLGLFSRLGSAIGGLMTVNLWILK